MFAAAVTSGAIVASAPHSLPSLSGLVHVLFSLKSSPSVFSYLGNVTHRACVTQVIICLLESSLKVLMAGGKDDLFPICGQMNKQTTTMGGSVD